jgi:hypothetical protein
MKSRTLPRATDGEIVMSLWRNHGLVIRKSRRPQLHGREERDTAEAERAAEVENRAEAENGTRVEDGAHWDASAPRPVPAHLR